MPVKNNLKEQRIGIIKKNINNDKKKQVTPTGSGATQVENKWKSKQWTLMTVRNSVRHEGLYLLPYFILYEYGKWGINAAVPHFSPTTKPHLYSYAWHKENESEK